MKISRVRFIMYFVAAGFAFQFVSNSLLGSEVRLFPMNGNIFPGSDSQIVWKSVAATLIFPIKFVLLKPLSFLFALPDPPPPIVVLPFVFYWSSLALALYYVLNKLIIRKKTMY